MSDLTAFGAASLLQTVVPQQQTSDEASPLVTSVRALPDQMQELSTPITLAAVLTAVSNDGTLQLQTSLGIFSLQLPDLTGGTGTSDTQKQVLGKLAQMASAQKPLGLTVQAGAPPSQAILLVPSKAVQETLPLASGTQAPTVPLKKLTAGDTLSVLPLLSQDEGALELDGLAPEVRSAAAAKDALKAFFTTSPQSLETGLLNPASPLLDKIRKQILQKEPSVSQAPQTASALRDEATSASVASAKPSQQPQHAQSFKILKILSDTASEQGTALSHREKGEVLATVSGKTSNGNLVLKTDHASYYVRDEASLEVGARLLLQPLKENPRGVFTLPEETEQRLKALDALTDILAELDPKLAQALFKDPETPAVTPALLLFVLSALKHGDPSNILGVHAARALAQAGKKSLLSALAHELDSLRETFHDPTVGQWQSWPIPVFDGRTYHMIQLCVHTGQSSADQENDSVRGVRKTRFLITLDLSHMGRFQLDGLSGQKQLDLVIRTEAQLDPALANELKASTLATLEAAGLTGSLSFQDGPSGWVNLVQDSEPLGRAFLT